MSVRSLHLPLKGIAAPVSQKSWNLVASTAYANAYKLVMTKGNFNQCWRIGQDLLFCLHLLQGRLRRNLMEINHDTVKKAKGGISKQYQMLWLIFKVQLCHSS